MKTFVIATGIILKGKKLLIGKRTASKKFSPNEWEFVSGFVEEKEPVEETILREVKEELGVKAKILRQGLPFVVKDRQANWIMIPFLLKPLNFPIRPNPKDYSETKLVSLKEAGKIKELKQFIKGLKKAELL